MKAAVEEGEKSIAPLQDGVQHVIIEIILVILRQGTGSDCSREKRGREEQSERMSQMQNAGLLASMSPLSACLRVSIAPPFPFASFLPSLCVVVGFLTAMTIQ